MYYEQVGIAPKIIDVYLLSILPSHMNLSYIVVSTALIMYVHCWDIFYIFSLFT